MKQFPFLLMAVLIALAGHSQQVQSGKKHLQGAQKIIYSQDGVTPSFINFAADGKPSAGDAVAVAMAMLHPGGDNALHEISTQRDRLGFTHHRLAQYYKGIAVEDGFWFVHERDSRVESMNGRFIPGIRLNVSPLVSEQSAVERALSAAGHPALGGSPSAQLLITAANKDYRKAEMRLAWKVDIPAVDPLAGQYIYVDAHSGEVICRLSKVCTVNNVSGQGATYYHGLRPITTDSIGPGQYELHETVSANGVLTLNMFSQTDTSIAVPFTDANNYWDTDSIAAGVHWAGEAMYDYYLNQQNRNSYDDNGGNITLFAHYGSNFINAMYYGGGRMAFGDGDPQYTKSLTSIDVVGHEYTHGVIEFSAGLTNISSYGALAESFSDIFGLCAHYYHDPSTATFTVGNLFDLTGGTYSRSLSDPKSTQNPDTYGGQYWEDPYYGQDYGGVHINCGLQNYWFYLLSVGDTGTNDNGDFYDVDSIGMDKAAQIAYRNLTVYLGSISVFADAREGSIQAARDLFGDCSQEVVSVTNAWYAVGVGPAYDSTLSVDFSADYTFSCNAPDTVQFSNLANGANAYYWDFGDGNNSTAYAPAHIYANPGVYDVKLRVTSCYNSLQDSLVKTAYVEVGNNLSVLPANCIPGVIYPNVFAEGIALVQYNDIDLSSYSTDIYRDYTCLEVPAQPTAGCSDSVLVETKTLYGERVDIWIDWNNDGTLSHPQEWVFTSDSGHFHTGVIPTPTNAVTGTYLRMRVRGGYYTSIDPCDSLTFGEVEDYAVYVWPELTISITHNDATNSNCDGDATANISGGRPVISYQWDDVNNQTTQTATGLCAGTYHVTVTDGNGCYIEDSVEIQTFTGMYEGVGTFSLNVFPNPSDDNFSVEMWPLLPGAEVQLVLTNIYGAVVREQTLSATALHQTVQFDRQDLAAGCYLLECRSGVFHKRVRLIMY